MSGMLKVFDGSVWQNIGLVDPSSGSGGGLSYKVYSALLNQASTDPPVATVLENTLGGTVTYGYDGSGSYFAYCTDCFTENKTFAGFLAVNDTGASAGVYWADSSTLGIVIPNGDSAMLNSSFEIRVYP